MTGCHIPVFVELQTFAFTIATNSWILSAGSRYLCTSKIPMIKKATLLIAVVFWMLPAFSQNNPVSGILTGNVMDEKSKALEGATVQLIPFGDTISKKTITTDKTGHFSFSQVSFGYYKLT